MLHTDIQTDRQTYRNSDEAGPRGAFAPNNILPALVGRNCHTLKKDIAILWSLHWSST